jgi:tRNA pseudouridine32 synthase/23S rRNA pseudouridine746 synthase
MAIAKHPSVVTMPAAEKPYPSIVEFLCRTFPAISRTQWVERILEGKVLDDQGKPITTETKYSPSQRIFYFREVENEPVIPFAEQVLFQDDELLVACKPHFLPVIPGAVMEECLLNRLRHRTGAGRSGAPALAGPRDRASSFLRQPKHPRPIPWLFMQGKSRKPITRWQK